jgi:hypothetical protein
MTITISRISLTKDQLAAIPGAERNLFVLLGHAANEINILGKLLHFATSGEPLTQLHAQAEQSQANLIGSILAGKAHEFWLLLKRGYFGSEISRYYDPLLDDDTRAALDELKRYFSQDNLIARVRNGHAFHYDANQVIEGFRTTEDGDALDIYLSENNANSLYGFADTIAYRGMLELIAPGGPANAISALVKETLRATNWAGEIMGGLMAVCLNRHVADARGSIVATEIAIEDAPDSNGVRIPFFIALKEPKDVELSPAAPQKGSISR